MSVSVGQENDAVVDGFLDTAFVNQVQVVVRVQVDHARQYRVGFGQVDNVGCAQDLLLDIGIHFHNLAVLYDDARVRSALIADAVKQPTAANNQLPFLPVGPLSQRKLRGQQNRYDLTNQLQDSSHFFTVCGKKVSGLFYCDIARISGKQ